MVPLIFRVHSPPLQVSTEMLGQKPTITRQPMSCCSSSFATSSNDLSAVVVTTVLPFAFRIAATCISFPPASVTPVYARLRHRTLIDNVTAYLFEAAFVARTADAVTQDGSDILPLVHWLSHPSSCLPFHRQPESWARPLRRTLMP